VHVEGGSSYVVEDVRGLYGEFELGLLVDGQVPCAEWREESMSRVDDAATADWPKRPLSLGGSAKADGLNH